MPIRLHLIDGVFVAECRLCGPEGIDLLGIVDSGASVTYVTVETRRRVRLEPTGKSQTFTCVHGQNHAGIATRSYHGKVTLGPGSGSGTACGPGARIVVGGRNVGAVLGRDVLRHLNVALNWKDGNGFLEG